MIKEILEILMNDDYSNGYNKLENMFIRNNACIKDILEPLTNEII